MIRLLLVLISGLYLCGCGPTPREIEDKRLKKENSWSAGFWEGKVVAYGDVLASISDWDQPDLKRYLRDSRSFAQEKLAEAKK